ncbi:MAG: large subunit ribosomal protein [Pseudomonadota bacterium]|nr:large subunit ribosomal protein [Pseudomonadota bacterium]
MSLNLESKKTIVADVNKVLQNAATVVIAEYQGVTVDGMTSIRKQARQSDVYLHVLKNTLARKAVSGTVFEPLADKMSGPLVYGISTDPIAAAKIINEFAKTNNSVKIVGGMFNDKLLDEAGVKQLASIPGRNELLSMLLGVMQQIPASFARVVAAIRDQKEQAA